MGWEPSIQATIEVPQTSLTPDPEFIRLVGRWVPAAPLNLCQPSLIPPPPFRGKSQLYFPFPVDGPYPVIFLHDSLSVLYFLQAEKKNFYKMTIAN